jgi:hypothetical protein
LGEGSGLASSRVLTIANGLSCWHTI